MMFDMYCIKQILAGNKTVTRRIKRNNKRPAVPGKIHKLKIDRTAKTYGKIKIISCEKEHNIFAHDPLDADKEGFVSDRQFITYWLHRNPDYFNEPVWRVEFELITKN